MILAKTGSLLAFERVEEEDISALHDVATLSYFQTYFGAYSYPELKPYLEDFFSEKNLMGNLSKGLHEYFLVRLSGRPIGFSFIKMDSGFKEGKRIIDENSVELSKLYLLQKYTGKGIGTRFVEMMAKYYSQKNISVIFSTSWSLNQKALRFYKKQGFLVIGEIEYEFAGKNNIDLILRKNVSYPNRTL